MIVRYWGIIICAGDTQRLRVKVDAIISILAAILEPPVSLVTEVNVSSRPHVLAHMSSLDRFFISSVISDETMICYVGRLCTSSLGVCHDWNIDVKWIYVDRVRVIDVCIAHSNIPLSTSVCAAAHRLCKPHAWRRALALLGIYSPPVWDVGYHSTDPVMFEPSLHGNIL